MLVVVEGKFSDTLKSKQSLEVYHKIILYYICTKYIMQMWSQDEDDGLLKSCGL